MLGIKDSNTQLCPAVSKQKLQITRKAVEEKELALNVQKFYLELLGRYLSAKHGPQKAEHLLHNYNQALKKLREMREILLEKTLQF